MMYHDLLELLHTIVRQQSNAVLLAKTEKASQLAMDALGNAGDVYHACRDMIAAQSDEANYAIARVTDRLRKASAKSTQATVKEQIRLAIRQLDTLYQPITVDTEPIDIFFV